MSQNNQKNSSDKSNNKYLIIAGIAIVVVIALAIAVPHFRKQGAAPIADTAAVTVPTTVTTKTKGGDAGQSAWEAMLAQYSGRLIVFGADCKATPTDHIQALGSTVLLANNSDVEHTISVGGASGVKIGAHHYKTAKIATSNVQVVSCDTNAKAATITVK